MRLIVDFETRADISVVDVGPHKYFGHPSNEILCTGWRVDDGSPPKVNVAIGGSDGRAAVERRVREAGKYVASKDEFFYDMGRVDTLAAHNAEFEMCGFDRHMPELRVRERHWSCTAARARRLGLPGSLADACRVLNTPHQKSMEGHNTMLMVSQPRPVWRTNPLLPKFFDDADRLAKTAIYCVNDILAEADLDAYLPELPDNERLIWEQTTRKNHRGIRLDHALLDAMDHVIRTSGSNVAEDVRRATGIDDFALTNVEAIKSFCAERGVFLDDLRAATVEAKLGAHRSGVRKLPESVVTVLSARQESGGKSSNAKLATMRARMMDDDRTRDTTMYHGAHTGRDTGSGINVLNLPRPYKGFDQDVVVKNLLAGDLDAIRREQKVSPEVAVSAAIRGLIVPSESKRFVIGDYSSVEPCCLFTLARQWDAVEVLRNKGNLYIEFGKSFYGRTLDKAKDVAAYTLMKGVILGCLGPDTQVLTSKGTKPITDITENDWLWDGIEWICSSGGGCVTRGVRTVMEVEGLWLTDDHLVLCGDMWLPASHLRNESILSQALVTGSANLPSQGIGYPAGAASSDTRYNAHVGQMNTELTRTTFTTENQLGVMFVLKRNLLKLLKAFGVMLTYVLTTFTENAFLIESLLWSIVAPTQKTETTGITAQEASRLAQNLWINESYSHTSLLSQDGTIPLWNWIDKTMSAGTSAGTYGLLRAPRTCAIDVLSRSCSKRSMTYDIALAGPRNRFTVVTDAGPLIVHNCGYGLGADNFVAKLQAEGSDLPEADIRRAHAAYRSQYPEVPRLWNGIGEAMKQAIRNPGRTFAYNDVPFYSDGYWLIVTLPSGRALHYPNARLQPGKYSDEVVYEGWMRIDNRPAGWGDVRTWGARTVENLCQSICRDVMAEDELEVEALPGWAMTMTVYDELVAECPDELPQGEGLKMLLSIMSQSPRWFPAMPVRAEGFEATRYSKG